ncbi:MAG: RnfH family protein [Halomonadaceae bacterium]|nr:MAG: RnfH family protein [Halomonadaceae bacterium]
MRVEVAYARPERQLIVPVTLPAGSTVHEAVLQSGIMEQFPEIDLATQAMGIFGQGVKDPASHLLKEGDRVEIYRPLIIDPKQARADRARKG